MVPYTAMGALLRPPIVPFLGGRCWLAPQRTAPSRNTLRLSHRYPQVRVRAYAHNTTRRDAYPRAVNAQSRPFFVAGALAVAFVAVAIAVTFGPLPGDAAI